MGEVRIQDRIEERVVRQYAFRGDDFVEVMRGEAPEPGDQVSASFGEPGFRLTFDEAVHSADDLPPGLTDALNQAVEQFEYVREDGGLADEDDVLDPDDSASWTVVEGASGPVFVDGHVVITLDTDDAGLSPRALARVISLLVAAVEPFTASGSVEIGAATESDRGL